MAGPPANGFTDVGPGAWYRDAVTWAKARGIVAGFADNTFRGRGNVNRGQMAQWLFNLAATPEAHLLNLAESDLAELESALEDTRVLSS